VSESYREGKHKVKTEWGFDRKFAIKYSDFQVYNAEKAYPGDRFAGLAKGAKSSGGPVTAIVTFAETGGSTITIPAPEKPETSGGAPQAAPQAAQESTAPTPPCSEGGIQDKKEPRRRQVAPARLSFGYA
jgi:hypothetical protein